MRGYIADMIFQKITGFYEDYLTRILEAAGGEIDIILTGDDYGTQDQSFVSPQMWTELLGDGFACFNKIIHDFGAKSMHHTCGCVTDLEPLFIERGLDILQSLQPEAMSSDYALLKEKYHGQLSFHGGMSVQKTLPFGTGEDISGEVKRLRKIFGPGGGYIISTAHNVQSDCSVENVEALIRAYQEFGGYR